MEASLRLVTIINLWNEVTAFISITVAQSIYHEGHTKVLVLQSRILLYFFTFFFAAASAEAVPSASERSGKRQQLYKSTWRLINLFNSNLKYSYF